MASKIINTQGRRKSAVARATIKKGTGKVKLNGVLVDAMHHPYLKDKILEPIIIAGKNVTAKLDISVNAFGGGANGQAEATRLAIAKGLVEWTEDKGLQSTYLDYDRTLLVADVRRKEPYKPNDSRARSKRQSSKR